jgi:hypothetical protein
MFSVSACNQYHLPKTELVEAPHRTLKNNNKPAPSRAISEIMYGQRIFFLLNALLFKLNTAIGDEKKREVGSLYIDSCGVP